VFIASTDGTFVHEQRVRCDVLRPLGITCFESTSNFVHWYDRRDPGIELMWEGDRPVALEFNRTEDLSCRFKDESEATLVRCAQAPRRARLSLQP
jgi:hypothetical protein